ncbi:MAG: DNA-processing protein DprA [Synergistaceae bacterium]|jgi:DNA processing protein|nr:DNA-processing protein DprA [Synergistaceae bacterium]
MDDFLRVKLLLNACKAPLSAWESLKAQGIEAFLAGPDEALLKSLGIRPSSRARLMELCAERDWPERELDRTDKFEARFVTADDPDYPSRLKDLPQPPIGLYVKGRLDAESPSLAIVGTRRCSVYGRTVAETVGRAAARAGCQVVSGGAKGIDAAGHRGCLAEGGVTAAVLGTAVDRVYPAEHHSLFREIAERGALVSEYPMGTGGEAWRFPDRNRLIAGLCGRAVVVESPEDGGSMITARLALNLGREIWCVPGRITESSAKGSNALIRDGANALIDIDDFIEKISSRYGQMFLDFGEGSSLAPPLTAEPPAALSANEKAVLELLRRKGGRTLDDLMAESGLGFAEAQSCLAALCAADLVYSSGPGRYSAGL